MKIQTGIFSLLLLCSSCGVRNTASTDVVKDNFDFASQQLKYAFTTSVDAVYLTPHELHKSNNEKIPVCIFIDFLY